MIDFVFKITWVEGRRLVSNSKITVIGMTSLSDARKSLSGAVPQLISIEHVQTIIH